MFAFIRSFKRVAQATPLKVVVMASTHIFRTRFWRNNLKGGLQKTNYCSLNLLACFLHFRLRERWKSIISCERSGDDTLLLITSYIVNCELLLSIFQRFPKNIHHQKKFLWQQQKSFWNGLCNTFWTWLVMFSNTLDQVLQS